MIPSWLRSRRRLLDALNAISTCYIVKVMKAMRKMRALTAILLLGLLVASCGGGGGATESKTDAASGSEASAQFLKVTGPNELLEFGSEATQAEREAANTVLQKSFKARAAANFAVQCAILTKEVVEKIKATAHVSVSGKAPKGCVGRLKEMATPLTRSEEAREDRLDETIPAMRIKGKKAFAVFHGTDGKNWVIPMEKESGSWRVAALEEEELPTKPSSKPKKASTESGQKSE